MEKVTPPETEDYGGALILPRSYDKWEVHKFGGASLADAKLYRTCGNLLIEAARKSAPPSTPTMAVVSAAFGTTDELIKVVRTAEKGDLEMAKKLLTATCDRVLGIAKDLGGSEEALKEFSTNLERDYSELAAVLHAIRIMKSVPDTAMELVTGMGEVWSAQTMCAYLQQQGFPAVWMDCRSTLHVEDGGTHGLGEKGASNMVVRPMMVETAAAMRSWWVEVAKEKQWGEVDASGGSKLDLKFVGSSSEIEPMVIVTGFVATTPSGVPTTLKRSGSDFTATIMANLCNARSITMWKNVDGIYTADPRKVPDAFPIKSLMYEEAMELAYFGASVLHPSAMAPCIEARVPVYVRNVFNPTHPGTEIRGSVHDSKASGASSDSAGQLDFRSLSRSTMFGQGGGSISGRIPRKSMSFGEEIKLELEELDKDNLPVKGITCVENVSLVNLEDAILIGVPGVLSRMFGALAAKNISVLMITQASSEHSTSCAVADCDAHAARDAVREAFALELHNHQVSRIQVIKHLSAVAAVGEGMAMALGVPGKMFTALASAGIQVRAIAQGSSKRNITAIVARDQLPKAMRAIHSAFTLSAVPITIGIVGVGNVGRQLVEQIRVEQARIKKELNLDLRVRVVVDVGRTLVRPERIDLDRFEDEWAEAAKEPDVPLDRLHEALLGTHYPHCIVIDCTAAERVAAQHKVWLQSGIHVISANRKAGSSSLDQFLETLDVAHDKNVRWSYAVTADGPLPSMVCLQDLLNTGDNVKRLEGMLSSTMDHVLSAVSPWQYDSSAPVAPKKFSEAVVEAIRSGCTEAIGLEDLLCRDMARKLTILARLVRLYVPETLTCEGTQSGLLSAEAQKVVLGLNEGFSCGRHCVAGCIKCAQIQQALAPFDDDIAKRSADARAQGKLLRCVGVVDVEQGFSKVQIKEVPITEDLNVSMCDGNTVMLKITSDRYTTHPLTLTGPGTGPTLIAGAVFADVLRIGQSFH